MGRQPAAPPRDAVLRLARAKAAAAALAGRWTLGADTLVVRDGAPLGKPLSDADALRMIRSLSGRGHEVVTGACVLAPDGKVAYLEATTTRVRFRPLDDAEARAYVASGEPRGKAGAYAVQGIGAALVEGVSGSYTNVVGLPLAEVVATLRRLGALTAPWLDAGVPAVEGGT